ncbi:MAG: PAS domain-containing protein [bacterium]
MHYDRGWILEIDGSITDFSDKIEEILGYSVDEIIGSCQLI